MNTKEKVKILRRFDLFGDLPDGALSNLATATKEIGFNPRETIINEGETGTDAYLIYEGLVRIYRVSEDGKEVNLSIKGQGEIVGEMAIFDHGVRTASVEALKDTRALKVTKRDLENLLISSPKIAFLLLGILSKRLYENSQLIEELETKSLKDRVISVLIALNKYMPKIILTQEQLASLVGATRPRVSEVLRSLKESGFLKIKGHELIVLQRTE